MFSKDIATNIFLSVALLGLFTLVVWALKSSFVGFVLERFGVSSRAKVTRSVEVPMRGGSYFLIFYEFNTSQGSDSSKLHVGFHRSGIALQKNDTVAVQYWSRFPSVNRMFNRTA